MSGRQRTAIVWPINPGRVDKRGCPEDMHVLEPMIHAQKYYADHHGGVYWDYKWIVAQEVRALVPMTGYLYVGQDVMDVPIGRKGTISYRMVVERITTLQELAQNAEEQRFVPPWRIQCLQARWRDGTAHEPSPTWIKTSNISLLSRGYSPRELGINADYVRRGVYIEDLDWR